MKKLFICIIVSFLFSATAFAQRDLACYPIFRGKIVPRKQMVITEVRGGKLLPYKLSYYYGANFQVSAEMAGKVSELVSADAAAAESVETEFVGDFLTFALVQPESSDKFNRYLCYQARPAGKEWKVTILYLEGPATLQDLYSVFEKQ